MQDSCIVTPGLAFTQGLKPSSHLYGFFYYPLAPLSGTLHIILCMTTILISDSIDLVLTFATMSRSRAGYGSYESVMRMIRKSAKRSAQESDGLRENERKFFPSKSARAEQSLNTTISHSELQTNNEWEQCNDEPMVDFVMDAMTPVELSPPTTIDSPTFDPDSNDQDMKEAENNDNDNIVHHVDDGINHLQEASSLTDVENPFWIQQPHQECDGRFQYNKKQFEDFNIVSVIYIEVARKYRVVAHHASNADPAAEMFCLGSSLTAKQAHTYINANAAIMNLNKKDMNVLLDMLKTLFPNAVLPTKLTYMTFGLNDDLQNGSSNSNNNNKKKSYFTFDCCPCGQEVYVGEKSNNKSCSICKLNRYTDERERTALEEVNYRPLSLLLLEALQTNWFYELISRTQHGQQHNQAIFDVTQGPIARKHMQEMHERYEQCKLKSPGVREVSLLLSAYYDGAPLFKSKAKSVWPLVVSVLNLPPPLRVARGKGLFTLTLYTHKKNTARESFAIEQFVNELLYLMEGFAVEVQGHEYFIQARLIMHCYDSRGLEGILQLQGSNSYAGCSLCGLCEG